MKTFMNWSGGKDSALALSKVLQDGVSVETLVTSVNSATDRISMHGVRRSLLKQQAIAMGLPLRTIELPGMPGMEAYENTVRTIQQGLKSEGYTHGVFGDIFLEDLRKYREELLASDGLQCLFPLWQTDSKEVVRQFLETGIKAIVVCVNSAFLDKSFCGRVMDEQFFADLPAGVDPCGENGEYHSYVFDGPLFLQPINFKVGEKVFKEYPAPKGTDDCFTKPQPRSGFYFCDLLPL
jgi:uncharacterized protein (TIGR00290 family)